MKNYGKELQKDALEASSTVKNIVQEKNKSNIIELKTGMLLLFVLALLIFIAPWLELIIFRSNPIGTIKSLDLSSKGPQVYLNWVFQKNNSTYLSTRKVKLFT
jgi:hypothetical protein